MSTPAGSADVPPNNPPTRSRAVPSDNSPAVDNTIRLALFTVFKNPNNILSVSEEEYNKYFYNYLYNKKNVRDNGRVIVDKNDIDFVCDKYKEAKLIAEYKLEVKLNYPIIAFNVYRKGNTFSISKSNYKELLVKGLISEKDVFGDRIYITEEEINNIEKNSINNGIYLNIINEIPLNSIVSFSVYQDTKNMVDSNIYKRYFEKHLGPQVGENRIELSPEDLYSIKNIVNPKFESIILKKKKLENSTKNNDDDKKKAGVSQKEKIESLLNDIKLLKAEIDKKNGRKKM